MILICDRTGSERALAIREKLFSMDCPAAVCTPSDYRQYLPAGLIVTFTDTLDTLRQKPLDHIHAIVLGEGFVNSALNAQALRDETLLPDVIRRTLLREAGNPEDWMTPFGIFGSPDVFFGKDFFQIRGETIEPTRAEYMIFKYLMADRRGGFITPDVIGRYCVSGGGDEAVAVHISNLNKKAKEACGYPIIEAVRYSGYRVSVK